MRIWKCGSFVCVHAVHSQGYQRLEFAQDEQHFVLVGLEDFASLHRFSPTLLFSVFCSFVVLLALSASPLRHRERVILADRTL